MARTRLYRDGVLALEGFPTQDLSAYAGRPDCHVWLDLCDPTAADFDLITEQFGLHELAVEDARHAHQRAKLDRYRTHLFLSAYAVYTDTPDGPLRAREISAFITANALITVRASGHFDMDRVVDYWDDSADLAKEGVGFLLHGLLDCLVDGHFKAVQQLDEQIEALEQLLFEDGRDEVRTVQRRSYDLRKDLVLLRRVVLPMREVVNTLLRRDLHTVSPAMLPYYQDVYDHVLRATEWTESLRDLVNSVMDTNLNVQGNRLNLIMKKVTSWASIIAVPTAITGFYGQNVPFPGDGTHTGFLVSSALMLTLSVALYLGFKRRDWI
ncbi:magnesium transporter CorA family protein [Streptomyces sp. NBC_00335]|uniref:magnesium transporter CorA family protein n=1 Tax=unclassified Streptomyces TaxID=2593676 RepID=UPI00225600CA|nr:MULTISPECIES: magnesium transporter CorA family protein [unclassified Streptomyces]MCX5409568.1 magnesium transporter CorA family protein [Streptomyces sp. NBC_00086]